MNIVLLVRSLLLHPKETWEKISLEKSDIKNLFLAYGSVLALVPAVSVVLGFGFVGVRAGAMGYFRLSLGTALLSGLAAYLINLLGVYTAGLVMRFISNYFHAEAPLANFMALAMYSATPVWLAGIFYLIPALSLLNFLGIYGVYLFYLGLPQMVKIPEDKVLPYTVAVIVAMIVVALISNYLISQFIYGPLYSEFLSY